ncbi:unnamed protein product [Alopecurus aequalis]
MICLSWRPYLLALFFLCLPDHLLTSDVIVGTNELVYNGFSADLNLDGKALWFDDLLSLTNGPVGISGHAFCSYPLSFQNHPGGPISSFSTTFVFVIGFKQYKGNGLAFMLSSTSDLPDNSPGQYLGLPSDGHGFFAVEFDTVLNSEIGDIDANHVGIDVNSFVSVDSHTAGFYGNNNGEFQTILLRNGEPVQAHMNILGAPSIIPAVILIVLAVLICRRLRKSREDDEWEIKGGMPSFTYKDLAAATEGFSDRMLLGKGGFGRVYKGVLPTTKQHVAIKRVSPESKQGKKEFIAEIAILGHVRHRNLVQLLGYCRYKKELLLVYDYMPNGSLERYLYDKNTPTLDWAQRFRIIKGIASSVVYLHEDWEQVIIHRDIKASNVLLDDDINGRLGDFGLARLHDHGADAHTTLVAGTWGYIAPELARLGKATKATDVFAFGVPWRWSAGKDQLARPTPAVTFLHWRIGYVAHGRMAQSSTPSTLI